ncbi:probable hexosyltransferase MUCI70 [Macadamia integrifolia]|uniref:probable hexosyltransferase MUCI70 n=1 Tax=Macadamia integrifolia TaxID=60698 RepID=UPI001C532CF0|nr:probable hexosyltransferase MUCI70 [Macadamia integrifolia]
MTGGSLGLRTGSYGSLQQQLQNSVLLPIQTSPIIVRKPSKMLLPGSRDKERCVPRICKFAGRRRVGMLLVVAISVLVFMSVLSVITKDEDVSEVVSGQHMQNIRPNISLPSIDPGDPMSTRSHENKTDNNSGSHENKTGNNSSLQNNVSMTAVSEIQPPPPSVFTPNALPFRHPCEKFALPPPPNDRKRTGPRPCPVCYLPVEQAITLMPKESSTSPVLRNLTYVYEENSIRTEPYGGSEFGGYPSLKQRNDSFDIKESMNVHCGFVKGRKPGHQTGFDIDDLDLLEMEQCRGIVVASAIFGNYDIIQQPKNISEASKKSICFFMFIDEETEAYMRNSSVLDGGNKVGLWRVVVVRNLPYLDARRNGKVPKLLLHRIFPNARFSIWIDGKLELVVDPYQILERFLWRKNATFAISRHYRRFDVFDEAEANKAAGKYDNASIDYQVEFYKQEGLTPYTEAKLPITSDVPEGCVIIKEHIPITNLFTCLWFNEVDRFTSRDQISFSTTRDKIMSKVNWSINMFLDCERRNFVVQAYHRDLLEHMAPPVGIVIHPPPALLPELPTDRFTRSPPKKVPTKRSRERRSSSRRHRKVTIGSRENNSF